MKKRIVRVLALSAAVCMAIVGMLFAYTAKYAHLCSSAARAEGIMENCRALIHGGEMSDAELKQLRARLCGGMELVRGADGCVWGVLMAKNPLEAAMYEMQLRGALGMCARADRWVVARGGRIKADDALWAAERLLNAAGECAASHYRGVNSASVRGAKYHAAVRAGACAEYMIAEGYLPVDY